MTHRVYNVNMKSCAIYRNGAISNDLERTIIRVSILQYSVNANIFQTVVHLFNCIDNSYLTSSVMCR